MGLFIAIIIIFCIATYFDRKAYMQTSYFEVTHTDYFSMKSDKGIKGEYAIYNSLKYLEGYGYRFLFNLYIPDGRKTAEIDQILITDRGIFVFESKNYSGWIFGDEHQTYWTQTLPAGRRAQKEKFYNPILQNKTHIEYLKKHISDYVPVYNVIIFGSNATLKNVTVQEKENIVTTLYQLPAVVDEILTDRYQRYGQAQIDSFYNQLYPFSQADQETKYRHIQNARAAANQRTFIGRTFGKKPTYTSTPTYNTGSAGICPYCGGKLVVRIAKRGSNFGSSFYGCSNYPKCRYTKNI